MSNPIKFLALTIFIVSIWTVNSFLLSRVTTGTENISSSKNELTIKQSFNEASPANLSKSINEFIVKDFDKNKLVNLIDSFAQQSGIKISNLDIKVDDTKKTEIVSDIKELDAESTVSELKLNESPVKINTLKIINLSISFSGDKNSIDLFLSKLSESKQYLDVQDISFSFNDNTNSTTLSSNIKSTITANVYYINL